MSQQVLSPVATSFTPSHIGPSEYQTGAENLSHHVLARRIRMLRPRTAPSSSSASTSMSASEPVHRDIVEAENLALQSLEHMAAGNNRSTSALPSLTSTTPGLNTGRGLGKGLGLGLRSKSKSQLRPSETWAILNQHENGEDRDEFVMRFNEAAAKLDGVRMLEAANFRPSQCESEAPEQPRRSLLARLFRLSISSPSPKEADAGLKLTKRSVGDYVRPLVKKNMPRYIGLDAMIRISGVSMLSLPYPFLSRPVMLPACLHETGVYLLENHMGVAGLFRVPGSYRIVNELYEYYLYAHHGGHDISETIRCQGLPSHIKTGPHDVASAFKRFLNAIPGGILGSMALFEALEEVTYQHTKSSLPEEEQTKITANLIALAIGAVNYQPRRELICGVFGLLALMATVAKKSVAMGNGDEQLGAHGLGIVFGPLLTGGSPSTDMSGASSGGDSSSGPGGNQPVALDLEATKRLVEQAKNANDIARLLISLWKDIVPELKINRVLDVRIARPFTSKGSQQLQPQQPYTRIHNYRPFSPTNQFSVSLSQQQSDQTLCQTFTHPWRVSPIPELSPSYESKRTTSPESRSRPQSPLKSARKLFPKAFASQEKDLAAAAPQTVHIRRVPSHENSETDYESKVLPHLKHRERMGSQFSNHQQSLSQSTTPNMPVPLSYIRRTQPQHPNDIDMSSGGAGVQFPDRLPAASPRQFAFDFDDDDADTNPVSVSSLAPRGLEMNRLARTPSGNHVASPLESSLANKIVNPLKRRELPASYKQVVGNTLVKTENKIPISSMDGHFQSEIAEKQKQEGPAKLQKLEPTFGSDIKEEAIVTEIVAPEISKAPKTPKRALRSVRSLGALFHRHHGHSSANESLPTPCKAKFEALSHKRLAELEKGPNSSSFNVLVDSMAVAPTIAVVGTDTKEFETSMASLGTNHKGIRKVPSNVGDIHNMVEQSSKSQDFHASTPNSTTTERTQIIHETNGGATSSRADGEMVGSTSTSTSTSTSIALSETSAVTTDTCVNKERSTWKMTWRSRALKQHQSSSSSSLVRPSLEEVRKLQQEVDTLCHEVARTKNQESTAVHVLKEELRECQSERRMWKARAQEAEEQLKEMLRRDGAGKGKDKEERKVSVSSSTSQYSTRQG
ncbi:uncharacterized protein BROUX77_003060 [Berkeleyomyces rouxiae]|uniref:uncharacterized protein n=1 Tax=Berkeleyomyces rouxiae TaxID=2035830 RepID=UPI003B818C58